MEPVPNVIGLQQLLPGKRVNPPLVGREAPSWSQDQGRRGREAREQAPSVVDAGSLLDLVSPEGLHLLKSRSGSTGREVFPVTEESAQVPRDGRAERKEVDRCQFTC